MAAPRPVGSGQVVATIGASPQFCDASGDYVGERINRQLHAACCGSGHRRWNPTGVAQAAAAIEQREL